MSDRPHTDAVINGGFTILGAALGAVIAIGATWATITATQSQSVAETVRESCTATLQQIGLAQDSYLASIVQDPYRQTHERTPQEMPPFAERADGYLVEANRRLIEWRLVTKEPDRLDDLSWWLFEQYSFLHSWYGQIAVLDEEVVPQDHIDALEERMGQIGGRIQELETICRQESGLPPR